MSRNRLRNENLRIRLLQNHITEEKNNACIAGFLTLLRDGVIIAIIIKMVHDDPNNRWL